MGSSSIIQIAEGRFARLQAIEWWDQNVLDGARILVIGAGALGNEVLKNLALLGVGQIAVCDMDRVEMSNLSRSVLFQESDEGRAKAECAAESIRKLYPRCEVHPMVGNILTDFGLGVFRWADVVIGALDNREARVFVNSACARVGRPWFDGGIEVFQGIVRGFAPPATACYECTMSAVDWDLLNKRRSCSLLARRAAPQRGTPTTPTTASVIGGLQVAEVLKQLHGLPTLLGSGYVFEGAGHSSYRVNYPINPDCPWHEPAPAVEAAVEINSHSSLQRVWDFAESKLGPLDSIELARELVEAMVCPTCNQVTTVLLPAEKLTEDQLRCPTCGNESVPRFLHSLAAGSEWLEKSAHALGLPPWDIVWARRRAKCLGVEFAGDHLWSPGGKPPEQKGPRVLAQIN